MSCKGHLFAAGKCYTVSGAARALGKHRHTVSHWIKEGEFPVTRMGNSVMISEEVLCDMAVRPDGRIRIHPYSRSYPSSTKPKRLGIEKISGTYYTASGAAVQLGKHRNTITRWVKEGKLPAIKLGTAVLIPEEAICALRNKQPETDGPD